MFRDRGALALVTTTRSAAVARPLLGIVFICATTSMVPFMDAIAKHLSTTLPITEILWARYIFHLMILLPVVLWRHGFRQLRPAQPLLHAIRGTILVTSTGCFFVAISRMAIADALSLLFVAPLAVTALSPVLLGEHVGGRRWTAVGVGFLGALIIMRPGLGVFQEASLWALAAGLGYALFIIVTRKLSGQSPPLVTLTTTAIFGVIATTAIVPFDWVPPSSAQWSLLVGMGVIVFVSDLLFIKAFDHASAASLAPILYFEIVASTFVSYVFFNDFPDRWTWLGVSIVIASGVYISVRERRRACAPSGA